MKFVVLADISSRRSADYAAIRRFILLIGKERRMKVVIGLATDEAGRYDVLNSRDYFAREEMTPGDMLTLHRGKKCAIHARHIFKLW